MTPLRHARFAVDSPLEGARFEPVPRPRRSSGRRTHPIAADRRTKYRTSWRVQGGPRTPRPKWPELPVLVRGGRGVTGLGSPLAPFSLFYRLFLDRVVLVEADQSLDVVAGGDAFLRTEAGKITARLELGQGALGEVKADE